tara:strand:- start:507 stop:1679 length:1173 start_codon:yes stop_codon:yes gene_type:complete
MGNALSFTLIVISILVLISLIFYNLPNNFIAGEFYKYYLYLIGMLVIYQLKKFLSNYLRLHDKFYYLAVIEFIQQTIVLIVVLSFIEEYSIYAVLFSVFLSNAFFLAVGFYYVKDVRLILDIQQIKYLIITGLPLMLYGLFTAITISIDRLFIAAFFDSRLPLGYYQLGYNIAHGLFIAFNSITYLFYPKWLKHFNQKNKVEGSIFTSVNKQTNITECLLIILSIIGITLVPSFINIFAVEYQSSILISQIILLSLAMNGMMFFSSTFLVSNNYQLRMLPITLFTIIFAVLSNYILLNLGYGLYGIAVATLSSYYFYGLQVYFFLTLINKVSFFKTIREIFFRPAIFTFITLIILWEKFSLFWIWFVFFIFYLKPITKLVRERYDPSYHS